MASPKVVALRPGDVSPKAALAQLLEEVDTLKAVFIVKVTNDGEYLLETSTCTKEQIATAFLYLHGEVIERVTLD